MSADPTERMKAKLQQHIGATVTRMQLSSVMGA